MRTAQRPGRGTGTRYRTREGALITAFPNSNAKTNQLKNGCGSCRDHPPLRQHRQMDWLNGHARLQSLFERSAATPATLRCKEAPMWWSYKPYVSVAKRQANAAREIKKLENSGRKTQPVNIEGTKISRTFWGKSWCENLESFSDYSNRLPRGRTYVRNGSVCDLQIAPGRITALVSGSALYKISVTVSPLPASHWKTVKQRCAGEIGSVIELLQGRLCDNVMRIITQRGKGALGLFPKPDEIKLSCTCPDYAGMCKHVAAALYGVGARLDQQPELLFVLRQVNHLDLISSAADFQGSASSANDQKTLVESDLADVFGIDLNGSTVPDSANRPRPETSKRKSPPTPKAQKPTAIRSRSAKSKKPASKKIRNNRPALPTSRSGTKATRSKKA